MENHEEHNDIREKLRNLPKVKANRNFLHSLHSRIEQINSEEYLSRRQKKKGAFGFDWFTRFVDYRRRSWAIPAVGFTIVAVIVFSVYIFNIKNQNPLIDPLTKNQELLRKADSLKNLSYPENKIKDDTQKDLAGTFKNGELQPTPESTVKDKELKLDELKTTNPTSTERNEKKEVINNNGVIDNKGGKLPNEVKSVEQKIEKEVSPDINSKIPVEKEKNEKDAKGDGIYKKKENNTKDNKNTEGTDVDKNSLEKLKDELGKSKATTPDDKVNDRTKDNSNKNTDKKKNNDVIKKKDENKPPENKLPENKPPENNPPKDKKNDKNNKTDKNKKVDQNKEPEKKNENKKENKP